jgi:hypothetical protein
VAEATVIPREDALGDRRLAAYVVASDGAAPTAVELRRFLAERVPHYMVPSSFDRLDALPLTVHGKLDRDALLEPDLAGGAEAREPPRTPWERRLAALWKELLGVPRVGRDDSFFEMGGHSLKAAALAARLLGEHALQIELVEVFRHPTLAGLACLAEQRARAAAPEAAAPGVAAADAGIRPATAEELAMLDDGP